MRMLPARRMQAFLQCIERTRADIAEYNTQCAHSKDAQIRLALARFVHDPVYSPLSITGRRWLGGKVPEVERSAHGPRATKVDEMCGTIRASRPATEPPQECVFQGV